MKGRLLTAVSCLVIAGFVATLLLCVLVPLYTDEVAVKMQLARTLLEGGRAVAILPQCTSSFAQPLPASHYPAAVVYHVLFAHLGLLGLKISAIVIVAATCAGVWIALWRRARDAAEGTRRFATFVALQSLGTFPLAFVSARSEPILVLVLALYAAFPFAWSIASRRTRAGRALVTLAFVVLGSVFYFSHVKALFFTPVVLVSLGFTFGRRRMAWLVIALACTALTVGQTYAGAERFTQCPEAPSVQKHLTAAAAGPGELHHPLALVRAGFANLAQHEIAMADMMSFAPTGPQWLPSRSEPMQAGVARVDAVNRRAFDVLGFAIPLAIVCAAVVGWRRYRRRAILAVALVACTLAHSALTTYWSFYHQPFVFSTLVLAAVVAPPLFERRRVAGALAVTLQLLALASVAALFLDGSPRLAALAKGGAGMSVPDHPGWVPALGFGAEKPKIVAHAATCGIRARGERRLVIDDATLFAFDDLREPLHLIYVSDANIWGGDFPGPKNIRFLRDLGASGIISRCPFLPTALEPRAKKADGYCCVSAADLQPP